MPRVRPETGNYAKAPAHGMSEGRKGRSSKDLKRKGGLKIAEIEGKKKKKGWAALNKSVTDWMLDFLGIAVLLLFISSCSPAQKLSLCEGWAEKHPDTFLTAKDTIFKIIELPGDTIRGKAAVSAEPLTVNRERFKLTLKELNPRLIAYELELKPDTVRIEKVVNKIKLAPRPIWHKNKFTYYGAGGALFVFLLLSFLKT